MSSDEPQFSKSPIFILGCERSGTSLLRRILNSHSRIACPSESKFILPLSKVLNYSFAGREGEALTALMNLGYSRAEIMVKFREFISSFFEGYAKAKGKVRWADKTPDYLECLDFIHELYPDAHYLAIFRHPFDVVLSLEKLMIPRANNPELKYRSKDVRYQYSLYWHCQTQRILDFLDTVGNRHQIHYEHLVTIPEIVLRGVFHNLGEDFEPGVLRYWEFPHDPGFEDPTVAQLKEIEPRINRFADWDQMTRERWAEFCDPAMTDLGYTIESSIPTVHV